ncbi:MAG: glycosyltransferase [Planctomycetota bacterium]
MNKFYHVVGGSERYLFVTRSMLEAHGHEFIPFAMESPENEPTPWSKHFVSAIDFRPKGLGGLVTTAVRAPGRMIYSLQARRCLRALLDEARPDIAHLHMIEHQISPSVLPLLKERGVPVVLTAHQYKLVCPNYTLYNERTGLICERCVRGSALGPLIERCHRGSVGLSVLLSIEAVVHRALDSYRNGVQLFHAPSRFLAGKLIEGGFPEERVVSFPYGIEIGAEPTPTPERGPIVYLGRLSHEKGIGTLLRAMQSIPKRELWIVGDGPSRESLVLLARELGLDRVKFLGRKTKGEIEGILAAARLVVVPSEWFENSPLVIYEAFAAGRPVVGARRGGIPELIEEGETGRLFEAGDARDLRRALEEALQDDGVRMGQRARDVAESELSTRVHYPRLTALYERARDEVAARASAEDGIERMGTSERGSRLGTRRRSANREDERGRA